MIAPHRELPAEGEWTMLRSLGVEPLDHTGLGLFLSESGWFSHLGGAFGFFSGLFGSLEGGSGVVAMTAGRASPGVLRDRCSRSPTSTAGAGSGHDRDADDRGSRGRRQRVPPGLDVEIAERDGYVLRNNPFSPHPLLGLVLRQRLEPESVADSVADARQWFRERGRARFTWAVADTATPADLGELLLGLGLRPDEHDPVAAGMVLEHEPPGTPGIEVRRVETFDDQLAGHEVSFESFELTEEEIAVARERCASAGSG